MGFDFSKIKAQKPEERITDPVALFQSLRVTDTSINDLWLAQGDALRNWNDNREKSDVSISLNTGAGKTLIGLLIGQSLVNESRSLVLYACSSIQLVQQTAKKAEGYGLPITTYIRGNFSNDLAMKGEAICLTTYQALFNGKSVFFREDIAGVVFDDAHAGEHLLRDHFSLHLEKAEFGGVFAQITSEFAEYFHSIGLATTYEEVVVGDSRRLLLVPPFEVKKVSQSISKYLRDSAVSDAVNTLFSWEHLKDRIDLCSIMISADEITITPPFVPVRTLPYFANNVRRVYLSATLSALDGFVRTFGRKPSFQISPTTTAGECERMILMPDKMLDGYGEIDVTKKLIRRYKALILVPSYGRTEVWGDIAQPPSRESATEVIEAFKLASAPAKLLLAARYDGMDLPGDMCRVVVIDDLPSGVGLLERFQWEHLGFSNSLRTSIASRIVQSFGRISRGMSDHGVVFITGRRLLDWLQISKNMAALPRFLQKQLALGFEMSGAMTIENIVSSVEACLGRQKEWIEAYERFLHEASHEESQDDAEALADMALAEAKYAEAIWDRDFEGAAQHLRATFDVAGASSVSTVCWHKLWVGYALEHCGDLETAKALYKQAHAGQKNIPPQAPDFSENLEGVCLQAINAARQFEILGNGQVRIPRLLDQELSLLDGSGSFKQVEEALRCLGQYLGLQSTRPDNEHGTGPDVLWISSDKTALCFDAKTDKGPESVYRKDDCGQLADHVQWVRDNTDATVIISGFIGEEVPSSPSANPQKGVKVASLKKFHAVGEELKVACRDISGSSFPLNVGAVTAENFGKRGLLWPKLLERLELLELRDLT